MSKKSRGFMDLDSDDDDFEPKAKPGTKSKRRAGDSDEDFAPAKLKKKKRKDEVLKTSTQGKVDSAIATGRGGRPTARLSVEEAKFQEDLQLALRVSSEEDLGGGGDSDDDLDHLTGGKKKKAPRTASKKETELVVVNDEGSIVLGDSEDEDVAVAECPNSSSTTVILGEEESGGDGKNNGEVSAKGDCENIVLEDTDDEETEVAKVVEEQLPKKNLREDLVIKNNSKPKRTIVGETWVVGERSRRSSGDQRSRRKPQKYVESSDSENDLDGVIDSNESDEEFEEEKKKKQPKTKKVSLKKPDRIQADKNPTASRISKNPAGESRQSKVLEKKVLEVSPPNQPTPASPVRPFGIHNPSSPCTTPTPSLSLPALLKLKASAGGSKPPSPNLHRGSPAWKPPAKVGSSLANSTSLPASPGLSPGLRRLGLSRNWKSPAPLHKNLKLSQ